jgi:hypothetical protein
MLWVCVYVFVCVCVALFVQHGKRRMRRVILPSVACPAVPYSSALPHNRHQFQKKNYRTQNVCFDFIYNFCLKIFILLSRTERGSNFIVRKYSCEVPTIVEYASTHVKYPLLNSTQVLMWSTHYCTVLKYSCEVPTIVQYASTHVKYPLLYSTQVLMRSTHYCTVRKYSCEVPTIVQYASTHVKYPLFLSEFKGTWILPNILPNILKYQIS